MSVLRLAIPSPLRRLFDYLPPTDYGDLPLETLRPGTRVLVPFGRRELVGFLVEVADTAGIASEQLKAAKSILDREGLLPADLVELANWASHYYHHPPGEVYSALFPKRLRTGRPRQMPGTAGWALTAQGLGLPQGALQRSPKQARAIALLQGNRQVPADDLAQADISAAILRALADKGLIERCVIAERPRDAASRAGPTPTPEQSAVLESLRDSPAGFHCHLLEGVTGSGKTEIYLRLIADCLTRGQQALVLIPEIGLTPQTLERFRERFDANIAVLHSGLSEAQRYQSWEAAIAGTAHIVIGTRSAVFTPLAQPGLIIVDEEHDSSYKQQDGFRYSARDVAVKRGQLLDCPVLLGSATPSLESIQNASTGRYGHHLLTRRAGAAKMPDIRVLDVRRQVLEAGLSPPLLEHIATTLHRGEQALLFLNRRGYAHTLRCHDCGWIGECNRCDARLTVHRRERRMRCHHCGAARALPARCPECNSHQLIAQGLGTEQTEVLLKERFGHVPVFRVDSDTMHSREAMAELAREVNRGEPAILLGTQMLTKGHHFPAVTLVAVIDSDAMLFSADFRGEERMAQLLTQVAGRAGRADRQGVVLLQSHYPDHPLVQAMLSSDYARQARELLRQRSGSGLPPCGQLAILRVDCADAEYAESFLQSLRRDNEAALPSGVSLIGPLPSPMQRRAGKHRFQLIIGAARRRDLHVATRHLVAAADSLEPRRGLKWNVDVDPQDLF